MALDGKYLARARGTLEQRRAENARAQARREREAYARVPGLQAIDERLRAQMIELLGLTLRHEQDPAAEIQALERANLDLQAERAELMTAHGLPIDYTDEVVSCPDCRDTGYLADGTPCRCLMKLYNAEATRDLSSLLQSSDARFAAFDLALYDDGPGLSPRKQMAQTLEFCRTFAEEFEPGSPNLLLQGGTGLGKTFLSACIARTVSDRGFSVAYESAAAALGAFESAKFQRYSPEGEQSAARVEQYLSCDLMILDDLGTEMISAYSVSALYTLINTRLTREKTTIINTNCTDTELQQNYTPQILSRIEGEYQALPFVGRDIRQVRKERIS